MGHDRFPRQGLGRRVAAVLALFLLSGCGRASVLAPAGPVAEANRTILLNALTIMLAIVIPTIVAALGFAWWYRAGNAKARYDPEFVYSGRIELIVWSIPILVILFLGGVIWVGAHRLDPARPLQAKAAPLEVQVVALDWKWLFIYPAEGVASVNELVVPAGVPVHFSITSGSVMNAFFVPRMGSMVAAMPRMRTELNLQADQTGVFHGQSAQFSGDGFSDMHFAARAVPPAQFAAWVAGARNAAPALDLPAYLRLTRQGDVARPYALRAVTPRLFEAIVAGRVPDGPGPKTDRSGPQVSPATRGGHE
jgi:cytochrome o ubiquinol oxidase subunit 2